MGPSTGSMDYLSFFIISTFLIIRTSEGTFSKQINECFTAVEASRTRQTNSWTGFTNQHALRACMEQCLGDTACAAVLHYANRGRCVPVNGGAELFRDRDVVRDLTFVFIKRPGSTIASCSFHTWPTTNTVSPTPLSPFHPRRLSPSSPLRNQKDISDFVQSLQRIRTASTTVPSLDLSEAARALEPQTTTTTTVSRTSNEDEEEVEDEIDFELPEGSEFAGFEATVQLTEGPTSVPAILFYADNGDEGEEALRVEEFAESASRERVATYMNCTRPVGFSATVTQAYNITSPSSSRIIVFDDIMTNVGGFYNTKLGNFSPKCPGIFSFTVDLTSQRGTLASVHLMHNERVILRLRANGRFTGDSGTASGTALVALSEGDHVFVVLVYDRGYTYVLPGYTRFSGFMV